MENACNELASINGTKGVGFKISKRLSFCKLNVAQYPKVQPIDCVNQHTMVVAIFNELLNWVKMYDYSF